MKNELNKKLHYLLLLITIVLISTGCSNNLNQDLNIEAKQKDLNNVLSQLIAEGFNTEGYILEGDSLIIENCITFDYSDLINNLENNSRQYIHSKIVNQSNVSNIRIRIESNVPSVWKDATRSAIEKWNELQGTKIYIREVSSGEDLIVKYSRISPSSTIARATFPNSSGDVGHTITINRGYRDLKKAKKKFTMVHEIGHCIGMRHINNNESGRIHVEGTPERDGDSVMNPTVKNWNGFSGGDIIAAQQTYPPTGKYVTVYEHGNFTGKKFIIEANHEVNSNELKKVGLNDKISSIKLHNGAKIRVCEHSDFTGASLFVQNDITSMSSYDLNDQITSISWKVPTGPYVVLYEHGKYDGKPLTLWGNTPRLDGSRHFNDKVSSIKLFNGAKVKLYENKDYKGRGLYIENNISRMSEYNFNDIASSLMFRK